jgi:glycerophosphoryl diester phosphodiesterase
VLVTSDDVVVVSHDPVIDSAICSGPRTGIAIRRLTLAELREYDCGAKRNPLFATQIPAPGTRMPTLHEVFDLGNGNAIQFNVEVKIFADQPELTPGPEEFTQLILDSIRNHGIDQRVILQSFDPRPLRIMKGLEPGIRRAALFEQQTDWIEIAHEFEAAICAPEYHLVTAERVAQAHAAGLQVVTWTANNAEGWAKLADARVDAIISDDPASLIAWLREQGLR